MIRRWKAGQRWPSVLLLAALITMVFLAGCGSPMPRHELGPKVVYTSSHGIATQGPSGAVHFYDFKPRKR